MKEFVLDYARYRRLGFEVVEAFDFALSRPRVTPITAARAKRTARAAIARAQLRLVK